MPVAPAAQQIPAIVTWFQLYGNIVFFFAQLVWWIVTGFAVGWAACTYWRVSRVTLRDTAAELAGTGEAEADDADDDADDDAEDEKDTKDKVDVDKFVE